MIVENRHEPTTLNMRSYVNKKYKLTIHAGRQYGEMYDLEADPMEHKNLWNDKSRLALKCSLLIDYLKAELEKDGHNGQILCEKLFAEEQDLQKKLNRF